MIRPLLVACVLAPALLFAAPLKFQTPEGWKAEEPKSKMRTHQYHVPRAEGDDRDAKVMVFYFGKSAGGGLEANLVRWRKQIHPPDPKAKQTTRTCAGVELVIHDQRGVYVPPTFRPGAPKAKPLPGTRLINIYLPTAEGVYFVRFLGPEATVAKHEKAFYAFLDSIVLEGTTPVAKPAPAPASQPTSRPSK